MVFKKTPYSLTLKEKNRSGIFRRIVGGTDHLNQIEFPGPFLFLEQEGFGFGELQVIKTFVPENDVGIHIKQGAVTIGDFRRFFRGQPNRNPVEFDHTCGKFLQGKDLPGLLFPIIVHFEVTFFLPELEKAFKN